MSDHAKAAPTVGRCGMHCPGMFATSPTVVCALPAGHAGWHRSDEGTEWGIAESGLPVDTTVVAAYERGVAAGRRQAADELVYVNMDDAYPWLTCDRCNTPLHLIEAGDSLPALVRAAAEHSCAAGAPAEPAEGADR